MRPQEHVKLSAVAATLAWPWLKWDVWLPFTSSILIDADHYLWYIVSQRNLNIRDAVRYYQQGKPPRRPEVRLLHQPPVLGFLLLLAIFTRWRWLSLVVAGLLFHFSLDRFHNAQMRHLKESLNEQARGTCSQCGQAGGELELHGIRRPRNIIDRYNQDIFIVLCPACHKEAHCKLKKQSQTV